MRLFVALDIPEETRERLRDLAAQLAPVGRGARWVHPEGIHITLKFIGWLEDAKLAEVQQRLANVPRRNAIPIAFRNFGFFPNEKRPRVFYVGIEAGAELVALAGEIETQLEPLKIPKEERAYTPHLTLARFKSNEGVAEMRKILLSLTSRDFGGARATEFHLYQSVLKSTGAIYTKLATHSFAE
ncbi:MAG TPA: RNA 2',3'-cyclic phosphodiesterase [Candidatus Acidoferrales bacterium]|nr:RNA 2',3'-cyclic phosphodiesterase [Candidatus Acidoferrales bacterium]